MQEYCGLFCTAGAVVVLQSKGCPVLSIHPLRPLLCSEAHKAILPYCIVIVQVALLLRNCVSSWSRESRLSSEKVKAVKAG